MPFRETLLGPNVDVRTEIAGSGDLLNYAQRIISRQTSEMLVVDVRIEDEGSLRDLIEADLLNESGVNIDEELANLIVYQTSYSASARVVSVVQELFDELLRVF